MQQHVKTISEYQTFSQKLLLTTACTVILSGGISAFVQGAVANFAPLFPAWAFPLVQMLGASLGLWWLTKNGKKK